MTTVTTIAMSLNQVSSACASARSDQRAFLTTNYGTPNGADARSD